MRVLKIGTLDKDITGKDAWQGHLAPTAHIHTKTKVPWVILPEGANAFDEFYDPKGVWSEESLARLEKLQKDAQRETTSEAAS